MVEVIFWDNDGVLVDTERLYFEATRDVLARVGLSLTADAYKDLFLVQGKGAWHLAEEQGIDAARIERLRDERNARYAELLADTPLVIDGVADVLETLRGRYRMGVVTSSRRDHFDVIHARTGLLEYFDFVLTASDYPRVKPHPDPYLTALARCGAAPEACVAVEDSERGLAAATRAGIGCFVVPTALTRGSEFAGARGVLERVTEIPGVL